ncbi:MAG TPA: hypothetical protein VI953_01595 [Candidatus Paceibacterota bacterium]
MTGTFWAGFVLALVGLGIIATLAIENWRHRRGLISLLGTGEWLESDLTDFLPSKYCGRSEEALTELLRMGAFSAVMQTLLHHPRPLGRWNVLLTDPEGLRHIVGYHTRLDGGLVWLVPFMHRIPRSVNEHAIGGLVLLICEKAKQDELLKFLEQSIASSPRLVRVLLSQASDDFIKLAAKESTVLELQQTAQAELTDRAEARSPV